MINQKSHRCGCQGKCVVLSKSFYFFINDGSKLQCHFHVIKYLLSQHKKFFFAANIASLIEEVVKFLPHQKTSPRRSANRSWFCIRSWMILTFCTPNWNCPHGNTSSLRFLHYFFIALFFRIFFLYVGFLLYLIFVFHLMWVVGLLGV